MKKSEKRFTGSIKVIRKISLGKDRSEAHFPELLGEPAEIRSTRSKR